MRRRYEYLQGTGSGFNVQFFPSLNNTKSRTFNYDFQEQGLTRYSHRLNLPITIICS